MSGVVFGLDATDFFDTFFFVSDGITAFTFEDFVH